MEVAVQIILRGELNIPSLQPRRMSCSEGKGVTPNPGDAWCWSMWRGYLENEDGALVTKWFEDGGSRPDDIHTSGHASPLFCDRSPTR